MNWNQLLTDKTFRTRSPLREFDGRDPFENDYSRVISSTFVRRLQDKTQVFPLEESDFIRTRLTHSLEVSSIASSLGKSVEKSLIEHKKDLDPQYKGYIPSLLRIAGLVHDLGNPPFGHFGEKAIQHFFSEYFEQAENNNNFSNQELADFKNFDGNVQTFRILRKLQFLGDENSYNLTMPTLASVIKYPRSSITGNKGDAGHNISEKKFGFFASEEDDFNVINYELGLNNARHPVVFLLEAADDIAYSAADIEDGVKLGTLNFDIIHDVFETCLKNDAQFGSQILTQLRNTYDRFKSNRTDRLNLTVAQFRIYTQSLMIQAAVTEFLDNYDNIMQGHYATEIIANSTAAHLRKGFKTLSYIVFDHKGVIEAELAGWEVITGLLSAFVPASKLTTFKDSGNNVPARLFKMISSSFRYMFQSYPSIYKSNNENYRKLLLITDFISGMTDSYALNYYQKIKGIKI